jgi:hypothetical protein
MVNVLTWIEAHGGEAMAAYYIFSAAIGNLEAPDATSSKGYRWFYGFSNTLAANLKRAFATKLPSGALNTAENAAKEPAVIKIPAAPADALPLDKP